MSEKLRPIRSFVRREGRMTPRQQRALDEFWQQYGIEYSAAPLDLSEVFSRQAKTFVEIGFGMGKSLITLAKEHPEHNYIGIEVHRPGVGAILSDINELQMTNLKIISHDAVEVFKHMFVDETLAGVLIFFPDPWPKKRHHKRRLIQIDFVRLLVQKVQIGGYIHLATDWENYAEHMLYVVERVPGLKNPAGKGDYTPRPESRPLTKFEQRGKKLGHGVWDIMVIKDQ